MVNLKEKIRRKKVTIGSWLSFGHPQIVEMLSNSIFEWLVIDLEHTVLNMKDVIHLIQIIELSGCVPLIRVGQNEPLIIKQVMDAGAHGIIVPMVNSKEDAENAVCNLYYPPVGKRGVGLARAHSYGRNFDGYFKRALSESILIVQIEHIEAVNNLEEILSVKEVDGFIVGPYDLSGSLDHPGDWNHPEVKGALKEIKEIISSDLYYPGYHVVHTDKNELITKINEGYKFIAYGSDMLLMNEKIIDIEKEIREVRII